MIFQNSVKKIKIILKVWQELWVLYVMTYGGLYIYMISLILLSMMNVLDKSCREKWNTYFTSNKLFSDYHAIYEIMSKNMVDLGRSRGPGSSVGIATGYGLDGPGIKSLWGEIFCTCPDLPWDPPSLLYIGYWVFPRGKEWPGHDTDPSPPSSAINHERVELYLYSPCGPYGLYRASVPVQGCT